MASVLVSSIFVLASLFATVNAQGGTPGTTTMKSTKPPKTTTTQPPFTISLEDLLADFLSYTPASVIQYFTQMTDVDAQGWLTTDTVNITTVADFVNWANQNSETIVSNFAQMRNATLTAIHTKKVTVALETFVSTCFLELTELCMFGMWDNETAIFDALDVMIPAYQNLVAKDFKSANVSIPNLKALKQDPNYKAMVRGLNLNAK